MRASRVASRSHAERGAAVVEFALVVMLFLMLLVAVLEGGRLFIMQASLGSAARDAARVMAINADDAATQAAARADAAFAFGTPVWDSANSVACPSTPDPDASAVVSLTYPTGMMTGFWPVTFTLRGTGAMRCNG
ncbi:TadE family protein [Ornithinimicrobium tianjinense]|uniref:TadE-like domain-containing protein n=1 Tax=Ornithinimicrobium tianjinense TaxID=1195761 RepID=A0A917BHX9_9MICO|nr:TadE family protein [Ornithinimicrobium tianjinense]GGF44631.1 hypothetical protein GCM10011366_10470 [Ornithinimicrobium tianjinense]